MPTTKKKTPRKTLKKSPVSKTSIFRKLLTTPNRYIINGEEHELTKDVLMKVAENGNKLIEKGARIPTPFAHADTEGNVPSPVNVTEEGAVIDFQTGQPIGWRSDLNAGYVKSFSYGEIENESGEKIEGLIGELEVENSAASKLGTTITETSMGLRPGYTDSHGDQYEGYTPIHAALVTNAVEMDQSNFQAAEDQLAIAMNETIFMATPVEDNPSAPSSALQLQESPISRLIEKLKSVGLNIPDDTADENFQERLEIVIDQKIADLQSGNKGSDTNDLSQEPEGGSAPSAPIAMSETTPDKKVIDTASIYLNQLVRVKKDKLAERSEKLVATGRCSSDFVKKNIIPRIEGIVMSSATLTETDVQTLNESGELPKTAIEEVIEGLESSTAQDLTKAATGDASPPEEGETPPAPSYDQQNAWESDSPDTLGGNPELSASDLADEWAAI